MAVPRICVVGGGTFGLMHLRAFRQFEREGRCEFLALADISEAYALQKNTKRFQVEMRKFMAGHMRRKALIQRLVKAGIWEDNKG